VDKRLELQDVQIENTIDVPVMFCKSLALMAMLLALPRK